MPRRAAPSTTLTACVRVWLGLTQAELALYLGISPALGRDLKTGRRALSSAVLASLLPLATCPPRQPRPRPLPTMPYPACPRPTRPNSTSAAAPAWRRPPGWHWSWRS